MKTQTHLLPKLTKNMKEIIMKLQRDKRAKLFLEPVDYETLGLKNYLEIIKEPMDLSTVKKRIPTYTKVEQFKDDLQLIWSNCKKYNVPESVIYIDYKFYFYFRVYMKMQRIWKKKRID